MPRQSERFFTFAALIAGAVAALALSVQANDGVTLLLALVRAAVAATGTLALAALVRQLLRRAVARSFGSCVLERYAAEDGWTYGALLLVLTSAAGVQLIAPTWTFIALVFAGAQLWVLQRARRAADADGARASDRTRLLSPLFFLSGAAALIYQVAWQRALYTHFGVNLESITVIVSIFMFGLGIGALAGGRVSRLPHAALPWLFVAAELGVGVFGSVSIPLILKVGTLAELQSLPVIAATVFGLLAIPTLLMGATLPVLVAYVHRETGDVGGSVARLYFVNTLGSAFACFLTVDLLFAFTGLRGSTLIAAACNATVALLCMMYVARRRA
ncbi:MAG TPA: hypothetical protein VHB25_06510 [Gemmatimonadaceae bacterium]|nr:hypothetical protein [Gemmatimonadaceae bacterium]